MKIFLRVFTFFAAFVMIFGCNGEKDGSGVVKDIAGAAEEAELLFENEYVAAIEFALEPGDELPVYECVEHVLYALTSCEIEIELNGVPSRQELKRGSAYWRDAGTQSIENVGGTDARFIAIMRKGTDLPEFDLAVLDNDVSVLAPDNSVVLLEGHYVRVLEVILNPGQRVPGHSGLNRVVYSLTSYEVTYRESQMERSDVTFDEGDINWYDAGDYSITNIGNSPALFVVFQYLK